MRRAILLATCVMAALAPAATAAPKLPRGYVGEGGNDSAIGQNCLSFSFPPPVFETQFVTAALSQTSRSKRATPGRTFYAVLTVAGVGRSCSGGPFVAEVIPPKGVRLAIDRRHPLWLGYVDLETDAYGEGWPATSNGRDDLVRTSRGRFGGTRFRAVLQSGLGLFPLANGRSFELHVPLVASRRLNGTAKRRPRCRVKGEGQPPCSRRRARDWLQFAVDIGASVTPTLLVSETGLFTKAPPKRRSRTSR